MELNSIVKYVILVLIIPFRNIFFVPSFESKLECRVPSNAVKLECRRLFILKRKIPKANALNMQRNIADRLNFQ